MGLLPWALQFHDDCRGVVVVAATVSGRGVRLSRTRRGNWNPTRQREKLLIFVTRTRAEVDTIVHNYNERRDSCKVGNCN